MPENIPTLYVGPVDPNTTGWDPLWPGDMWEKPNGETFEWGDDGWSPMGSSSEV